MSPVCRWIFAALMGGAALAVGAQPVPSAEPQNLVQLSASASAELPNDWMSLTLSTVRESAAAETVQAELKTALQAALDEARRQAQPDAMQVRSGNFSLTPRYGREGRISAWQGTAELLLEGRDFARISAAAGRIQGLTVARVAFSLSRAQQEQAEAQVQAQAIARFQARAAEIARAFGFAGYRLHNVSVQGGEQSPPPRPYLMAAQARSAGADAPLPSEAGTGTLRVTVSGTIQLK